MSFIKPESLQKSLRWRYAVKSFDPEKEIPAALWETLETALQLTPSSYGLQPWKFLVVRDRPLRAQLRAVSWNQSQVSDCSHFVVFLHQVSLSEPDVDKLLTATAEARNIPLEKLGGYRKVILGDLVHGPRGKQLPDWSARQVYIALGNFMTAAALLGVDTCPMEGLDPQKYDEILGLTGDKFRTLVACAAGFRSATDHHATVAKIRYPKADLFGHR